MAANDAPKQSQDTLSVYTKSTVGNNLDTDQEAMTTLTNTQQQTSLYLSTNATTTASTPDTMAKKAKLTATEKAELKAAKEAEAQRKAEDKARKEEAKKQKDEEKRQRDEEKRLKQEEVKREREEKQKIKDAAKAEKDAEKKAKEEAQAKKERSQMKLKAFFKKPATEDNVSGPPSRRSSIASVDMVDAPAITEPVKPQLTAYEKTFPPFFLHSHTTVAPANLYLVDDVRAQWAIDQIETANTQSDICTKSILGKRKRSSYVAYPLVKRLMLEIQGSSMTNAIDVEAGEPDTAAKKLRALPIKILKFKEDVRPPWIGTYTRAPEGEKFKALCRNPFRRELPNVNYDYDSEAEWEEPEEGEELGSEGEEEDEEEDEDMEEFLDDEAAEALPKRKQLVGDLEPVYTDLHWESEGTRSSKVRFGDSTLDLEPFRIGILLDSPVPFPIDPFSTAYWTSSSPHKSKASTITDGNLQALPRQPLNTIQGPNQVFRFKNDTTSKSAKALTTAKPLPSELLPAFQKAVSGSNLSKIGLIEVLKKDFPQITKKTVEQTLSQIARRVGKKESEKTWQLIEEDHSV